MFLKWKGLESAADGDFFVRSGPDTVKLPRDSAKAYIRTRFGGLDRGTGPDAPAQAPV